MAADAELCRRLRGCAFFGLFRFALRGIAFLIFDLFRRVLDGLVTAIIRRFMSRGVPDFSYGNIN